MGGQYDEARPSTVQYYAGLVPNSEVAIIPKAGHLCMQDNPDSTNNAIRDFLNKIEK